MQREPLYLADMVEACRDGLAAVHGITLDQFKADRIRQLAVRLALQIIGEAARNVSEETRNTYPTVAWSQIVGLRNLLVHRYFRVDIDTIWEIVHRELPNLIATLEKGAEDE